MAKYMESAEFIHTRLTEVTDVDFVKDLGNSTNADIVMETALGLKNDIESTIPDVQSRWRENAMQRLGNLGMEATTLIADANEQGNIVPPLDTRQLSVIAMHRQMYAGLAESGTQRESKKRTNTSRIETDKQK